MPKKLYIIGGISFIFLLSITITSQIIPQKEYSEKENRPLKQKTTLTKETFLDGSFQNEQELYLKDQFPKRDTWMELKTTFEHTIGIKKINDVYFGKNDRLIQEATIPTIQFQERRIQNIKKLTKEYPDLKTSFLLVPTKVGIYKEETTTTSNQEKMYQQFKSNFASSLFPINTFNILKKHKQEQIYYTTDHHWTSLGAKYISEAFLPDTKEQEYSIYTANNHFTGSLANRIAYFNQEDTIELYVPKKETNYYIENPDTKKESTSLYDKSKQYTTNAYEIFLGGNTGQLNIKTTSLKENKLLIIKDSYANCFIPFILSEYREITIIDPRYYFQELDQLIEDKKFTDMLILYNMNTFFKDTSFDDLIENSFTK